MKMFDRKVILILVATVLLIFADAFAIVFGYMPSQRGGAIGLFLFFLSMLILTRLFQLNAAKPNNRDKNQEQSAEKGLFNLYVGVLLFTFALVSVFRQTRDEPVYLRIMLCGIDVAILGFLILKIYRKWTANADSLRE